MGMGVFLSCMPYFIRKGTRQTSLCVYHLRWDFMVEAMRRYFSKHAPDGERGGGNDSDDGSDDGGDGGGGSPKVFLKDPSSARAAFVCEQDDDGFYREPCLNGTCGDCGGFKLMQSALAGTCLLPARPLADIAAGPATSDGAADGMDDPEAAAGGGGGMDGGDDEDETPIDDDEDEEEAEDGEEKEEEEDEPGEGFITYDRWQKATYVMKNGETREKYDFVTVTVPLEEFWRDVVAYWSLFLNHHDLSKWNDKAWQDLKECLQLGNVAMVMDASEAHKHELRREHQSAYFSQITSTLWVVVLRIRVEDLGNITEGERAKLLAHYNKLGKKPIIRETHFYATGDKDKDQAQVQYILTDIANYLRGRGRWAPAGECHICGRSCDSSDCLDCDAPLSYFDVSTIAQTEKDEKKYYEGQGAPQERGTDEEPEKCSFKWIHAFSDGCASQFKCAVFLLFLSLWYVLFAPLRITWNWFCSAHGKCDCDPEG